jgi:DnaK suppressor protein
MARSDALLRLHKSLLSRRSELLKRLGRELQDLGRTQSAAATGDSVDAAFDTGNEEVSSQLAELEARELTQIDRALSRLRQGTYGVCEGCGSKIPVLRLNALPFSTLCIACQREVENDSGWLDRQRNSMDWEKVADADAHHDDRREIDLSDLEMDISK